MPKSMKKNMWVPFLGRAGWKLLLAIVGLVYVVSRVPRENSNFLIKESIVETADVEALDAAVEQFYLDLFRSINQYRPMNPPAKKQKLVFKDKCTLVAPISVEETSDDTLKQLSYMTLDYCFHLSPTQTNNLKTAHNGYCRRVETLFGSLDEYLRDSLMPRYKGIVTLGGNERTLSLLASIPRLRKMGSTLPIEVIFPPYVSNEDKFCDDFLPRYNGKCIYMSKALPEYVLKAHKFDEKMIRMFTPLVSTFKSILYMESNDFANTNVDKAFDSKSFTDTGLVLWPGRSRRSTSPAFYQIVNRKIDLNNRTRNLADDVSRPTRYTSQALENIQFNLLAHTPMHDLDGAIPDAVTHVGHYMIDKQKHFKTLMLAMYYAVHGEMWFDMMFAPEKGSSGYGENIVAAAHALELSYYQVHLIPRSMRGGSKDTLQSGETFMHFDPDFDYRKHQALVDKVKSKLIDVHSFDRKYTAIRTFEKDLLAGNQDVKSIFIEMPSPQFDPLALFFKAKSLQKLDRKDEVDDLMALERQNYSNLMEVLCRDSDPLVLQMMVNHPSKYKMKDMCVYLKKIVTSLKV